MPHTADAMPKHIDWLTSTSRRQFPNLASLSATSFVLVACRSTRNYTSSLAPARAQPQQLIQTPSCNSSSATLTQTPGPFYQPNSPQRRLLISSDTPGRRVILTGRVLEKDCQPVADCLVDIWHADPQGEYDNDGNRFRGHQFTDNQGNYQIETAMPGIYTGRTRHIHVKVQAHTKPLLTTQLYFPEESLNADDFLFQEQLLVARAANAEEESTASDDSVLNFVFDFVLA